jgi:hypothetical protein
MREAPVPCGRRGFVVAGFRKPSSVLRRSRPRQSGNHSSSATVTGRVQQPTRGLWASSPLRSSGSRSATSTYAALLQVGFAFAMSVTEHAVGSYPAVSPLLRGPASRRGGGAVYFLLHSPRGHPHRALPGTLLNGARTFLPPPRGRCPFDDRRLPDLLRRRDRSTRSRLVPRPGIKRLARRWAGFRWPT